jgi:thymidylate kinase
MIVCVTGPDGSGKSTQVDALAERLRRDGRSVARSTIWDAMLDPAFAGRALFERPAQADAYLELLDSTSRMYFLCHALQESLVRARARAADVVLLNAYWYKYYAVEVAHGGDVSALRTICSALPEPDVTFYLRVPPSRAASRKERFTGYETGFPAVRTAAAFEAFQVVAARELAVLAGERGWIGVPGEEPAAAITDRLLTHLAGLGTRVAP